MIYLYRAAIGIAWKIYQGFGQGTTSRHVAIKPAFFTRIESIWDTKQQLATEKLTDLSKSHKLSTEEHLRRFSSVLLDD